jgi:hypothetical protein
MKVLCKHCQLTCKKTGLVNCDKYSAIADKPQQLKTAINKAYKEDDYKKGEELTEELFRFNNG